MNITSILNTIQQFYTYLCGLFSYKYVKIDKLHKVNLCEIRYNFLFHKTEKIKEIIQPPANIHDSTLLKILEDIRKIIHDKTFKIKRLKKSESIYLYEDNGLLNNDINNIIIYHMMNDVVT